MMIRNIEIRRFLHITLNKAKARELVSLSSKLSHKKREKILKLQTCLDSVILRATRESPIESARYASQSVATMGNDGKTHLCIPSAFPAYRRGAYEQKQIRE